ncbi:hypothetical protein VP01_2408g1 [Puccinia sorghi]|uniref:Uncharacterized protein n=1 Tax=Puccinia sorghi TaxID=27349 RepID=A0A0L6V8I3_9BASI|nr:hypothetical protein VP01_2408g1 [Puccinia sorghi]
MIVRVHFHFGLPKTSLPKHPGGPQNHKPPYQLCAPTPNFVVWFQESSQWTNKPNFCMLLHLLEFILQYRTTSFFAPEIFKSYNYIAITFINNHTFHQVISCRFCFNKKKEKNQLSFCKKFLSSNSGSDGNSSIIEIFLFNGRARGSRPVDTIVI